MNVYNVHLQFEESETRICALGIQLYRIQKSNEVEVIGQETVCELFPPYCVHITFHHYCHVRVCSENITERAKHHAKETPT